MGAHCSNCGSELEPGAKYCKVCGFFIAPDYEAVEVHIEETPVFRDETPDSQPDIPQDTKRVKGKGKGAALGLAALFLCLSLLVIALIVPQIMKFREKARLARLAQEEEEYYAEVMAHVDTEVDDDVDEEEEVEEEEQVETEEDEDGPLVVEVDKAYMDYAVDITVEGDPGEKLAMVGGVIYNENGGSISGLFKDTGRYSQFYVSGDQTAGVVRDSMNTCLYITPDLQTRPLAGNVYGAGLSYSGDYVYYKVIDHQMRKALFMYEVATGEECAIEDTDTTEMVMSPSGEYIAYIIHDKDNYNKETLWLGGWQKESVMLTDDADRICAVSDDGNMVVFSTYDANTRVRTTFVWDNGNIRQLTTKWISPMYFTRDCSKFLYATEKGLFYYESGMDDQKVVAKGFISTVKVDAPVRRISEYEVNVFISSLDSLTGATYLCDDGYYMFSDSIDPVFIIDYPLYTNLLVRLEDRDICMFYDGNQVVYCSVGFDGNIDLKYPMGDARPDSYALNDDASILWYYSEAEEQVYMVDIASGEKTTVFGKIITKGQISLLWDSYAQKCFFISEDGVSYGAGADHGVIEYDRDCEEPDRYYDHGNFRVGYREKSALKHTHVLVFGRFVEIKDK